MENIKPFNSFNLNEAVQSKSIDVDKAQQEQGRLNDLIKIAKDKLAKIDAGKLKQFQKTLEKSKLTGTIAKLTSQLANSINKEAQALSALSKEQSKA